MNYGIKSCAHCGKEFEKTRQGHIYCCKKCSINGWYAANNAMKPEEKKAVCLHCGKEYVQTRIGGQKYCSKKCVNEVYRKKKKEKKAVEKIRVQNCIHCGKQFEYEYVNHRRIYCSTACYIKSNRQKRKVSLDSSRTSDNKLIKAKCPKCEKYHLISVNYIGTVTPRFYCNDCRKLQMISSCNSWDISSDARAYI